MTRRFYLVAAVLLLLVYGAGFLTCRLIDRRLVSAAKRHAQLARELSEAIEPLPAPEPTPAPIRRADMSL